MKSTNLPAKFSAAMRYAYVAAGLLLSWQYFSRPERWENYQRIEQWFAAVAKYLLDAIW